MTEDEYVTFTCSLRREAMNTVEAMAARQRLSINEMFQWLLAQGIRVEIQKAIYREDA